MNETLDSVVFPSRAIVCSISLVEFRDDVSGDVRMKSALSGGSPPF